MQSSSTSENLLLAARKHSQGYVPVAQRSGSVQKHAERAEARQVLFLAIWAAKPEAKKRRCFTDAKIDLTDIGPGNEAVLLPNVRDTL